MIIILIFCVIYLIIGTISMGFFTKSNKKPNVILLILWPVFVFSFLFCILYKTGKGMRNKLIHIRRENNGYRRRKQRTVE